MASIAFASSGDVDAKGSIGLEDAIMGLKVCSGISVTPDTNADVNGDKKIGLEEVIYALQYVAGLRTGTATTYTLSGTVSGSVISGVTITLSGTASSTATTNSSGNYSFTVTAGSYTVTPALSGYGFSPASSSVTVSNSNVSGVDFISSSSTSTIGDRTDYSSVSLTSGGTYSSAASGVSKQYFQYTSTASDTPAVKVSSGGSLTLSNSEVTKSGETANRENSGFYGFNAGVLASSSSQTSSYSGTGIASEITMSDCTITTSASGANGAFAFGESAVVNLDHVTIVTTGSDNSRGVDATYGGTVNISYSKISTQGGSCAALATDRYEHYAAPKINATNCVGTTAGTGSPGIYCTGTFNVTGSTLTATGSEAAVIEGLNSITLTNSNISGAKKWGVMIYQSMSGDSSVGTGTFKMTGGTLTNNSSGPMFFVCNTSAVIQLTGATLTNSSSDNTLLLASTAAAAANNATVSSNVNSSWGTKGGTVTFTATNQTLTGNIKLQESSSSITLSLVNSSLSGAVNPTNTGTAAVTIDANSTWNVTGDSYLSSLTKNGTISGTGKVYVNNVLYYTP
jgi:hypothetical protein